MQDFEIELGVGDMVRIGDDLYTVIDVSDGEVCFRVDPADEWSLASETCPPAK